ncbi:MAG: DsbA family protein [Firmicutes bacterium]|nr:DsbA family protein [Bacillota bacterium]
MSKITIEFFHDVICSFCFPMSYRMRELAKLMPEVEIVHRSFALVREEAEFDQMFGSRAAAKDEVLTHWEQANQNDDLHRFNIQGMREADFPFPTSMKGLLACKAASLVGGEAAYWDLFDALQNAFFVQSRNIGDQDVINEIVRETGLDFGKWQDHYQDPKTLEAVERDLRLVEHYGITSVPTLIINGKRPVVGALPLPRVMSSIQKVME